MGYSDDVNIEFSYLETERYINAKINQSYQVKKSNDRLEISKILVENGFSTLDYQYYAAEWRAHNDIYFGTTIPGVGQMLEGAAKRYMGVKDLSSSTDSVDMGPFMDSRNGNICAIYYYVGLR